MVLTDKRYKRFLMLGLSGILTGLCVAFPRIGIFQWFTLIPTVIFLIDCAGERKISLGAAYGYGFFFFMSFYLVVFHWFVNLYPLEFIDGMTKGGALCVVLFAVVGLSLFQAVQGGVMFLLAAWLLRCQPIKRHKLLHPFAIAALWAVYEWTQTLGWWGVPWGRLAIAQSYLPIGLQTASLFGSYFISFIIVAVNGLLAYAVLLLFSENNEKRSAHIRISAALCGALLVFQYGAGIIIWSVNKPNTDDRKITVAAIQGNIPSGEKWESGTQQKILNIYREYTLKAAAEGADIVVWPETALPWSVVKGNDRYKYLSALAVDAKVTILAGAFTVDTEENEYNSIVCFTPDGEMSDSIYHKRHLVPFGEFVPFGGLIETLVPPLANLVMSGDDVKEGEGANLFELEEGRLGSIICFDSIYEELTLESVREGAELICLSTNDSWFTDSAALYMHNAQAQLRAIECGRYVVRSANTGISTVITDRGEVIEELPPLVEGMIVREVSLSESRTLYSYIGNLFVYLCMAVLTIAYIWNMCSLSKKAKKAKISTTVF